MTLQTYLEKGVTKLQYLKAKAVVDAYEAKPEKIKTYGQYQFLWSKVSLSYEDFQATYIKAKSIESACRKFSKKIPKSMVYLDYEVEIDGNYIDISENEYLKSHI